jgi:hypothetical protein
LLSVTGESTTGTAEEAAAARDRWTAFRSEQMTSKDSLVEDDARAGRDVGRRRHDERAVASIEIAEGRVVE